MNAPEQQDRHVLAAKIKESPQDYKVCEGCGSIVLKKTAICPNCNAYRFNNTTESILSQAEVLANRSPLSIDKKDYL
jgi:uncharacterized OB-fold protein